MTFRFEDQAHQAQAVSAVVDLFEGALAPPRDIISGQAPGADGHHDFTLDRAELEKNLQKVTEREAVRRQDGLLLMSETDLQDVERTFPNFSLEMETGTGKTFVYIETALRLAELYGLRKFVILVHSVAIRAGVVKTFEQTEEHFGIKYPRLTYNWGVLGDSAALNDFSDPSSTIQFLIVSVQALDKPTTNTLYASAEQPQLWNDATSGVQQIAQVRPVVLIDEPQNMATPLRRQAIATLNPLVALRYSATHREPYNMVHRLGPKAAAEQGLVKRVSVKGIVAGEVGKPYIRIDKVTTRRRRVVAEAIITRQTSNGHKRVGVVLEEGTDLFDESEGLSEYEGLVVRSIERRPDCVVFENGVTMAVGQEHGVDDGAVWRDQVRHTIRQHLARQAEVEAAGRAIKVISLFFVERVADYVGSESTLPQLFDELFAQEWTWAGNPASQMPDPETLRVAYFPSTKTGIFKDAYGNSKEAGEQQARAYEEIITHKERILDRANPRAFIFSHSALREGWDNPNVFQVCFLRHSRSETERRQQIGRGLRLPVEQVDGNFRRVQDPEINRLTLIVDESFDEFRKGLNEEYLKERSSGSDDGEPGPEPDDADNEVVIRRRKDRFESVEFIELWKRIRYKARYRVDVDPDLLADVVAESEHLEDLRYISRRANVVQSAALEYDEQGLVVTRKSHVAEAVGERLVFVGQPLPNVLQLVEDHLQYGKFPLKLTRPTVRKIIGAVPDTLKRRVIDDPDQWARIVASAIRREAIGQMVKGITYEPMDESTWWDANVVFPESEKKYPPVPQPGNRDPQSGVAVAPVDGVNLFDHVDYDSHVERSFAAQLESASDHVKLFAKLPRRFRVRTPVGEYSPDWALAYGEDGQEWLYLVRETKNTLRLDDLEWDEAMRIRFAAKHFAAAPNGAVDYTHTTDTDGLRLESTDDD